MAEERTGCIGVGRDKCRDYNEGKSEDQCKRDDRNGSVDVSKDVGTVENDGNGFESNSMDEEYDKENTTDGDVGEGEGAIGRVTRGVPLTVMVKIHSSTFHFK